MAFDGVRFQIQTGGSDTNNGGGFCVDATFATDLAATVATSSNPIVTSASYTFITRDEGHYLFIKSGTNWSSGFYEILSTAGGAATLKAAIGEVVLEGASEFPTDTPLNIVAGCATTASPTGGTWGIDYTRKNTAAFSYTDMVIDGTTNTKYTSSANPVGPHVVGNIVNILSGTGFTVQRAEIISVTGTTATCDKSLGTLSSTGGTGNLGGAISSPGLAGSYIASTNRIKMYVKGPGTFNLSSSLNVSGGRVGLGNTAQLYGYSINRYPYNPDVIDRPIFQSNANTYSLIKINGPSTSVHCIDFENGNSNTTIVGFDDGDGWGNSTIWNCKFNALNIAFHIRTTSIVDNCYILNCTSVGTGSTDRTQIRNSIFIGNGNFSLAAAVHYSNVYYNNTWVTGGIANGSRLVDRCLFHSNTGANGQGVYQTLGPISNCIFWNNTGTGSYAISGVTDSTEYINTCAFGNNTNNIQLNAMAKLNRIINSIFLTADPCVDVAGGDFSLNDVAGGGALLKAQGNPLYYVNQLTQNFLDVGPVQSPPPATSGGGLMNLGMRGGFTE